MEKFRVANELLRKKRLEMKLGYILSQVLMEPYEWWHFNAMPLAEASEKLTVIK